MDRLGMHGDSMDSSIWIGLEWVRKYLGVLNGGDFFKKKWNRIKGGEIAFECVT